MPGLDERLAANLAHLSVQGRARRRRTVEHRDAGGTRVRIDGREYLAFCSNDYLGLAGHPQVVAAWCEGARRWGVGSGASHLVSGHLEEHEALEEELARFTGRPRALLFSTGYMANLAIAGTLAGRGDTVLEDRLNHASLLDAGLASGARVFRYAHGDAGALRRRLAGAVDRPVLVLTDGVFSMDGDVAPLAALAQACDESGAVLAVDDAHGFGVLGAHGGGAVEEAALDSTRVPVLMCTLGKALGTFGAFVAGSEPLVDSLLQQARTYLYTTALPPAVATATRASLQVMRDEAWRRERVLAHARRFRESASALGLRLLASRTPIQPLVVGSEADTLAASDALAALGFWVPAIRPPTVPVGASRLRITFSAAHSDDDVACLLEALTDLVRQGRFASS